MENSILDVVQEILDSYDATYPEIYDLIMEVIIKDKNRIHAKQEIEKSLKLKGIKFTSQVIKTVSKFNITKITLENKDKIYLVYEPLTNIGSGAGAAMTKIVESAQCLYASLAFNVVKRKITINDITDKNLQLAFKSIDVDTKLEEIQKKLNDDWIKSSISGANKLYSEFRGKQYIFHRGSKKVKIIENTFMKINRKEKAFGNINKWSPADIYLISRTANVSEFNKFNTLLSLNGHMMKHITDKTVIGVSLKKIVGTANLKKQNIEKVDTSKYLYKGYNATPKSIDGYVQWGAAKSQKIQFRSFGASTSLSGFQGEVKGASANQGKISLGPINYILKLHKTGQQIIDSKISASLAKKNTKIHARKIQKLMKDLKIIKYQESYIDEIQEAPSTYRYSKYLVLDTMNILDNKILSKEKKDAVVSDLYRYASSTAKYSAPFYKLS